MQKDVLEIFRTERELENGETTSETESLLELEGSDRHIHGGIVH